ncbi:MAG: tetratricopeptide repeat protein [Xanthomonadales bacterium]|nr:tetratricopeptide repeat protein [Xanthomonadales bacterium]
MSGMDEYILKYARQCAPLLAAAVLTACAGAQKDITSDTQQGTDLDPAVQTDAHADVVREPVDADVIYHVLAGEYLGGENNLPGSARSYAAAAEDSNDPTIAERASRISYAAEEWRALDKASARWLALQPQADDAHQLRAIAHMQNGRTEASVNELRWVIEHAPNVEEGWVTAAALVVSVEDVTAQQRATQALLQTAPSQLDEDLYGRSIFAYRLGQHEQAYRFANEAAADSDDVEIIRWAAQVAHAQEDTQGAIEHYRRGLKVAPRDRDLNLAYAELLRLSGDLEQALAQLETLKPDSAVLYTLAVYANSIKDQEKTARYYRQLRKLDEIGESEHFYFCGQIAEALDRYDEAVACYQQVTVGADVKPAKIRIAYALSQTQGVEAARAHLKPLLDSTDKEMVEQAYLADAEVLRQDNQLEAALFSLSDGLAVLMDNANLLYMRSLIAEAMGDIHLAEQDLRTVIQNDPNNAIALNALGYTLANRTDRYREALSLIEQAMKINPHDPATLDSMGWVLYRLGRTEEAESFLRRALVADANAEIAAHLGEVLWQLQRFDEAKAVFRQAQTLDASNPALVESLQRLGIDL